ncbi:MAG: serine hydrolase, partial [Pseudomonadota bacterium]
ASILQRMPARLSPATFGPLLAVTLVILLATLLVWFGGWGIRRRYGETLALSRAQSATRMLSRLGAAACVAVVLGWFLFVAAISADELLLVRGGLTPWMYLLYALGVLALCGVLAVLANAATTWFAPRRSRWVRAGEIVLALATIYLAWFIVTFGLVSFNVRF